MDIMDAGNAMSVPMMSLLIIAWTATASAQPTSPSPTKPSPASKQAVVPVPSSGSVKRRAMVTLHVVRVLDSELATITDRDMSTILAVAKETLAEKLEFSGLRFVDHGAITVEQFFARYFDPHGACAQRLAPWRYDPWSEPDFDAARPDMLRFLKRWGLDELRSFFPPEKARGITSYEVLLDKLIPVYRHKVAIIRQLRLTSGLGLFAPAKAPMRSYVNWICAVRAQDRYDVILTNEFLLYDLITEPYPHSIFKKCKVGGASLRSPTRTAMPGRALFASTFGMESDLPFFAEDPDNTLSRTERQRITGMFILAHELGHALFKLPDFYDHPPQCLMTTRAETDYISGYRDLLKHPGPCPSCRPYIAARQEYFNARELLAKGRFDEAIAAFKRVVKQTPKHIDGSYRAYLADIGVNIATAFWRAGHRTKARRWLKSARTMDPHNIQARDLWEKWFGTGSD